MVYLPCISKQESDVHGSWATGYREYKAAGNSRSMTSAQDSTHTYRIYMGHKS